MKYYHLIAKNNDNEYITILEDNEFKDIYAKHSSPLKNNTWEIYYHEYRHNQMFWIKQYYIIHKEYNSMDELLIDFPELILL